MFSIIWWIIWVIFDSISWWYYKKALNQSNVSKLIFRLFIYIFWVFNIWILLYYFWFEINILSNYTDLFYIFLLAFLWVIASLIYLHILKNAKLSELLPYENLDKLFIIIVWFFLFYWTNNWTSITTLLITIITLFVIIFFTIDFKNVKIPKNIWIFIFHKFLRSIIILLIWYLLTRYQFSTYVVVSRSFEFIIYLLLIIITSFSFKSLLTQTKSFYISRFTSVFFWTISSIISIFIIKELWVIVWTLFWFLWIASTILCMKLIINDSPTKKQVSLAFLVILLIWIWYYFK